MPSAAVFWCVPVKIREAEVLNAVSGGVQELTKHDVLWTDRGPARPSRTHAYVDESGGGIARAAALPPSAP